MKRGNSYQRRRHILFIVAILGICWSGWLIWPAGASDKAEPDKEKAEIRKQNEALKQTIHEYKSLEEDLMARRVFEKSQKYLVLYITLGGVIILLSTVMGIKFLIEYAKKLAKEKIEAITDEQLKKDLEQEGKRQITSFIKEKQEEFVELAQQQIARIMVATQPIGRSDMEQLQAVVANEVDYTDRMAPVRNSGSEGSGVGFAMAAALEFQINKTLGKKVTISPRHLYYYARVKSRSAEIDSGAVIKDAIEVLQEPGGVSEKAWPYKAGEFAAKPPEGLAHSKHYKIAQPQPIRNVKELKAALESIGPVVGGITLYESYAREEVSKSGKIPLPGAKERLIGGLAVCFVGFNDAQKLLKFRNNWGSDWGDQGYGYISYEYANKFLTDAWAFTLEPPHQSKSLG